MPRNDALLRRTVEAAYAVCSLRKAPADHGPKIASQAARLGKRADISHPAAPAAQSMNMSQHMCSARQRLTNAQRSHGDSPRRARCSA
jgi:hypothetical protein